MAGIDRGGELPLERVDIGPPDKRAVTNDGGDGRRRFRT